MGASELLESSGYEEPKTADVIDFKTKKKKGTPPPTYKRTMNEYVYPIKTYEEAQNVKNYYLNKTLEEHSKKGFSTRYRDYAIFTLGCSTGLRVSDLLTLKYKDLIDVKGDFRDCHILCEKKRRKARKIIWTDSIKSCLNLYFENSGIDLSSVDHEEYIFTSRQKSKNGSRKLSETNFSHRLKDDLNECIKLGLIADMNYNTHTMRKTFAWHLYVKTNYNISLVSKTLCHESVDVTMRYLGITSNDVDNALEMIEF